MSPKPDSWSICGFGPPLIGSRSVTSLAEAGVQLQGSCSKVTMPTLRFGPGRKARNRSSQAWAAWVAASHRVWVPKPAPMLPDRSITSTMPWVMVSTMTCRTWVLPGSPP